MWIAGEVAVVVVPAVPPVVDVAPVGKSIYSGGKFSFSVQASGTAPLSYQWLRNGEEIDGATSADYTVTASAATAGTYTVRVTNVHSSVVSDPAVATLIVPAPGSYKEYLAALAPVALWEFEETDGAYAYDTFGGHTASYFGVPEFAQPGASTATGKAVHLDASTYAVIGNDLAIGETASTAYRGDRGKTAYDHSQSAHAPADAEKNVQSDWNETDGNSDAFIKNKPAIPKAVTKTVQTLSDAASKSFTVTGYILSVILIDSATKEQVIGDVSFENATASANGKVTVTLAAAPSNPILVIITSIAL